MEAIDIMARLVEKLPAAKKRIHQVEVLVVKWNSYIDYTITPHHLSWSAPLKITFSLTALKLGLAWTISLWPKRVPKITLAMHWYEMDHCKSHEELSCMVFFMHKLLDCYSKLSPDPLYAWAKNPPLASTLVVVLIRLDALVLFLEVSSPEKWDLLMGTLGGGGIKSRTGEVGMIKLWTKREREGCAPHFSHYTTRGSWCP